MKDRIALSIPVGSKPVVTFEKKSSRIRVRINGVIHLSFPFREEGFELILHAFLTGNDHFYNADYYVGDKIIKTAYSRRDLFEAVLFELEKASII